MKKSKKEGLLLKESLLARVCSAVGTRMFRNLYMIVDGKKQDILKDGDLSCALFVSTVLVGLHLVKEVHASIGSTIADMRSSGWVRIHSPRVGCVVVWDTTNEPRESHQHMGFYIGKGRAISNVSKKRMPQEHSYRAHPVKELYWTSKLD